MTANPQTTAEAAKVISDLVASMDPWQQQNLNSVRAAVAWLRVHDDPALAVRASVRDMMEASQ